MRQIKMDLFWRKMYPRWDVHDNMVGQNVFCSLCLVRLQRARSNFENRLSKDIGTEITLTNPKRARKTCDLHDRSSVNTIETQG